MGEERKSKSKILIADDSEMNRSILADMLGNEFEILEAEDGVEAVAMLQKRGVEISLLLLDIMMPEMDGFDVLAIMNKNHWIEDIPVIMISAENSSSYVERAYEMGVTDYISRPFDALVVHRRVVNTIMLYAKQKKLVGMVTDQIYEKEKSNSLMIEILSHIVEFRNGESGLHVLHISTMTELLLKTLMRKTDVYHLTVRDVSLISLASALHDIGKIIIPENILNKPGKLTKEEFEVMKTHAMVGATMLMRLPSHQEEPLVKVAYEICRWHHERYDGKGYPDGLKGEEIPISAQIVSVADVYDALTSERVYKKALSHEKALDMILGGECGAFSPLLMECLLDTADEIREELKVSSPNTNTRREMRSISLEMLQHEELSASERTLQLLEHERTKYQFFASMSKEIQFEFTSVPPMLTVSEWGARELGVNEVIMDPLQNERILDIFGSDKLKKFIAVLKNTTVEQPTVQMDMEIKLKDEIRWSRFICRVTWSSDETPRFMGFIGKVVDIHEEHMQIADLKRQASHDALTGLLNHSFARQQIIKQLEENPDREYALLIIDLDYFKTANDRCGHLFGDQVLQYVADMLRRSIRSGDIAARVGGDEFLIFLEYKAELEAVVNRIYTMVTGEYQGFPISLTMGVAQSSVTGQDYDTLFHHADQALYAGKRAGRGRFSIYDDSMKDMLSVLSPIDDEGKQRS